MLELTPETTTEVETLLARSRERVNRSVSRREMRIETAVGGAFLIGAVAIAIGFDSGRAFSITNALMVFLLLAVASRVVFEVGSVHTYPTQVAFVPGLFLLPPQFLPLLLAAALILGKLSVKGLPRGRSLMALGDAFYALGPVLVLLVAGSPSAGQVSAPVLLLALASQFLLETVASGIRERLHGEASIREQLLESAWIYSVDTMLAAIGFALALASTVQPAAVLLAAPLLAVLLFLARDRTNRMSSLLELSEAYRGTARLLSNVIGHDDAYTGAHTTQVTDLAARVGNRLGLDAAQRRNVEFGALLHDVGKIAISNAIINKPGPLDEEEWQTMETHTVEGQQMLDQVGGLMSKVGRVVRSSHERFDGSGYPDGLAGEEIPIESRIVFCCDAYNAMTTDRPYRASLGHSRAVAELIENSGKQFDPRVVSALLECLAGAAGFGFWPPVDPKPAFSDVEPITHA